MLTIRKRVGGDAGITLAETLVMITLLSVVGAVTMNGIVNSLRQTATVQDQATTSSKLQVAIERVARELRAADPVEANTASATGVQVRIFRKGQCRRYIYRVEANGTRNDLVQYLQQLTPNPPASGVASLSPYCTAPAVTTPTSAALPAAVVATRQVVLQRLSSAAVFQYVHVDGTVMDFSAAARPQERYIGSIVITAERSASGRSKRLSTTTTVKLRNAEAIIARSSS